MKLKSRKQQPHHRLAALLTSLTLLLLTAAPSSTLAAETITYYHLDALGSPVAASDEQGNLKWREDYKPYGEKIRNEPASTSNSRAYTGHPHDNETGLTYAGARYYDPVVGRFMAVDPQSFTERDPHTFNRYVYGNNNPYKYVDPNGEWVVPAIIWAVGIGVSIYENTRPVTLDAHGDAPLGEVATYPGPVGSIGAGARVGSKVDDFVDGYRAVSKTEADDIATHGFRPNPNGSSMQDKWFSETREGAEKFRQNYSDLDEVIKARVPKDVYDRSYKHPNIDNTGPGFCVSCDDLSRLK